MQDHTAERRRVDNTIVQPHFNSDLTLSSHGTEANNKQEKMNSDTHGMHVWTYHIKLCNITPCYTSYWIQPQLVMKTRRFDMQQLKSRHEIAEQWSRHLLFNERRTEITVPYYILICDDNTSASNRIQQHYSIINTLSFLSWCSFVFICYLYC